MKLILEPTDVLMSIGGVLARRWKGETAKGVKVVAFIPFVAVRADADADEFEQELRELDHLEIALGPEAIRDLTPTSEAV